MASHSRALKSVTTLTIILVVGLTYKSAEGLSLARNRSNYNLTFYKSAALRTGRARGGGPPVFNFDQPTLKKEALPGQCGKGKVVGESRTGRIVGGFPVKSPIPWQVSLQALDEQGIWKHICGAALISPHHVVTASHCINSESKYRVVLGKLSMNYESSHEQIFNIRSSDIITHRKFGYITEFGNDIALLKIEDRQGRGAKLNEFVQPICLPDHEGWEFRMIPPTAECIVSGWGSTRNSYSDDVSSTLRVAQVPIQRQEVCRKLYSPRDFTGNYLRRNGKLLVGKSGYGGGPRYMDGMLCAGPLSGTVDSGRGDSGGPLACEMNGRYYLVGLVSWGQHFDSSPMPSVYTRLSYYLDWLSNERLLLGPTK